MTLTGLEQDYYLAGNDIWLRLSGFAFPVLKAELIYTNFTTGVVLKKLVLYPRPDNSFVFNCSEPVRALFPEPDHINNNNLQQISISIAAIYVDEVNPNSSLTVAKYFVRGHREKDAQNEWYLNSSQELIVGPWPQWWGVDLPGFAQRIQGSTIVNFVPANTRLIRPKDCAYKIIKFLNSLGGYQYYLFEFWEIKEKAKSRGISLRAQTRLREHNFRSLGVTAQKEIQLKTSTPYDLQDGILDLVRSSEVYMYDEKGNDNLSKWVRLDIDSNTAVKNSKDLAYDNELTFNIVNNLNIWL